jgi:hypothetical protein
LEKTSTLCTYCASPAAPVGDFCTESLFEKTSILRTYCAIPAAPVGDFCTESLFEKTSILRTYCAIPAAPVGNFCTESLFEKTSILRTYYAILAAPVGDFCAECRTRGQSALPLVVTLVWSNAEDRRCGLFRHWLSFFAGDFCLYITWRRLIKNLTPWEEKSAGRNNNVK